MIKYLVIIICFMLGLCGILHHYLVCDRLFDLEAMAHHEPIIVALICLGIGIIIGNLRKGKEVEK